MKNINLKNELEYIVGKNAVKEAIKSNATIEQILVCENSKSLSEILSLARMLAIEVLGSKFYSPKRGWKNSKESTYHSNFHSAFR